MIRVGIAGAAGKMGRALVRAIKEHPELTLASAWERPEDGNLGQDAGLLAGVDRLGIEITASPESGLAVCDVAVDFTAPEASLRLLHLAQAVKRPLVIGTTGLDQDQLQALEKAGERMGLVYSTNYSAGMNLLWALSRRAAAVLGEEFDVEIVETHHRHKKDAPSGSAITLLEAVCQGKDLNPKSEACFGRHGLVGARPVREVGVHAVRAGDVVGDHMVLFAGPGERLELKHQALSRDILARGAARAASWIVRQPAGFYRMADVLGLSA